MENSQKGKCHLNVHFMEIIAGEMSLCNEENKYGRQVWTDTCCCKMMALMIQALFIDSNMFLSTHHHIS